MAKRFNNLDAALKYLRAPGAGADDVAPDAPANSQLKKYQDFKAGKVVVNYPRAAGSLQGSETLITVLPFGLPAANTDKYRVSVSQRALTNIGDTGVSATDLGFATALADTDITANGFKPAKAVVRNITGTTAAPKISKIIGSSYKAKASTSYTLPFGRITANPSYSQQKAAILAKVEAATGNKIVSFKAEVF